MRPLWLDFRRPPPGRHLPGVALLAVSLAGAAALMAYDASLRTEIDALEMKVYKLRRTTERTRETEPSSGEERSERLFVILAKGGSVRWEALFHAFESAAGESVTLLDISAESSEVTVAGEARDLPAAVDYLRRLQSNAILARVRLAKNEVAKDHPQHPVRFTIAAAWEGSTP